MIKVLLVDDHKIVLDGIKGMLESDSRISVVGTVRSGAEVLDFIEKNAVDVLITDISMPCMSGIELTRKISQQFLDVKVIILSMYITPDYIHNAISAGAMGYLSKEETTKSDLVSAIISVAGGQQYFSPSISQTIFNSYLNSAKTQHDTEVKPLPLLTAREQEILRLYVEGLSNQDIANRLCISIRTVETHKSNMMQKFNFKSTVELVKFAIRNKIVEP
jgi:DNA-binding NarL/FixJ family response regulator